MRGTRREAAASASRSWLSALAIASARIGLYTTGLLRLLTKVKLQTYVDRSCPHSKNGRDGDHGPSAATPGDAPGPAQLVGRGTRTAPGGDRSDTAARHQPPAGTRLSGGGDSRSLRRLSTGGRRGHSSAPSHRGRSRGSGLGVAGGGRRWAPWFRGSSPAGSRQDRAGASRAPPGSDPGTDRGDRQIGWRIHF